MVVCRSSVMVVRTEGELYYTPSVANKPFPQILSRRMGESWVWLSVCAYWCDDYTTSSEIDAPWDTRCSAFWHATPPNTKLCVPVFNATHTQQYHSHVVFSIPIQYSTYSLDLLRRLHSHLIQTRDRPESIFSRDG